MARTSNYRGKQGRKDSKSDRVNFDNERKSKFDSEYEKKPQTKSSRSGNKSRKPSEKPRQASGNPISSRIAAGMQATNPEMVRAASSIGVSSTVGEQIPTSGPSVPGIMSLGWTPTLTISTKQQQALKAAQDSILSFVVHANSRNYNYDAPDLMTVIIAGMNMFGAIANGVRAYGIMKRYSAVNTYTPDAILKAMGLDPADFRKNLANIWFDLNELISQTSQIWIPNTIPLLTRWYELNSYVFMDAASSKAQFYVPVQNYYLAYEGKTSTTGSSLSMMRAAGSAEVGKPANFSNKTNTTGFVTWENYKGMVQNLIDNLVTMQDRGIMMGDVLNAYGADKIFAMAEIPVDYITPIVYDKGILSAIENASIYPNLESGFGIEQNTNGMLLPDFSNSLIVWSSNSILPNNPVINFHSAEVTNEDMLIATMWTCAGMEGWAIENGGNPTYINLPKTCGTEVITTCKVWYNDFSSGQAALTIGTLYNQGEYNGLFGATAMWTAFDWAPTIYNMKKLTGDMPTPPTPYPKVGDVVGILACDFDNYVFVDTNDLAKVHAAVLYSELGVPVM